MLKNVPISSQVSLVGTFKCKSVSIDPDNYTQAKLEGSNKNPSLQIPFIHKKHFHIQHVYRFSMDRILIIGFSTLKVLSIVLDRDKEKDKWLVVTRFSRDNFSKDLSPMEDACHAYRFLIRRMLKESYPKFYLNFNKALGMRCFDILNNTVIFNTIIASRHVEVVAEIWPSLEEVILRSSGLPPFTLLINESLSDQYKHYRKGDL